MAGDAVALVRAWLEARGRGAFDEAVALMAPDVRWHSPVEGERVGRVPARELLVAAEREADGFESTAEDVRPLGDGRVAALVRNRGVRDGEELDSRQALVFTVAEGAIREVRVHVDDLDEVRSFWED